VDVNYAFWNNKGGTGKTSLAFQALTRYAEKFPTKKILAIDICPQANLSELMLGGLNNKGSEKLLERHGLVPRCSLGGYFQLRLPSPYAKPTFDAHDFITSPNQYNKAIPKNVDLVCGDPLLELQANAVNTLANQNIPGTNAWIAVIDWLRSHVLHHGPGPQAPPARPKIRLQSAPLHHNTTTNGARNKTTGTDRPPEVLSDYDPSFHLTGGVQILVVLRPATLAKRRENSRKPYVL